MRHASKRIVLLMMSVVVLAVTVAAQTDSESRVLSYIKDHLKPGQPLLITELYNNVFTQPAERMALDKLYSAFFRIPLFVVQYNEKFRKPPTLKVIAEQFDLRTPEAADVLLRVMEADPRVPHFFDRDAKTGEITRVDPQAILNDPRFGTTLKRQLGDWEGKAAPDFDLPGLDGGAVDSSKLRGRVTLLYVWFTGCPPCIKETADLVALRKEFSPQDVAIVGANADQVLHLGYDDAVRARYAAEHKIDFSLVRWTSESNAAFGQITIFPTLFLINRKGVVVGHWLGYVDREQLRKAIEKSVSTSEQDRVH